MDLSLIINYNLLRSIEFLYLSYLVVSTGISLAIITRDRVTCIDSLKLLINLLVLLKKRLSLNYLDY